jgi:hypothetical protein
MYRYHSRNEAIAHIADDQKIPLYATVGNAIGSKTMSHQYPESSARIPGSSTPSLKLCHPGNPVQSLAPVPVRYSGFCQQEWLDSKRWVQQQALQ